MNVFNCPICLSENISQFLSLGNQPLANQLEMDKESALKAKKYDLSLWLCNECLYVWLNEKVSPNVLFSKNTYLTGVSSRTRMDMQSLVNDCVETCKLTGKHKVLDIASNDGTLLGFFKEKGMKVLGIDPSLPACDIAIKRGIETINDFFNAENAEKILKKHGKMDIITATNIITHIERPKEFLTNCRLILKQHGTIIVEFYNFESIISNVAFDQIYHEHISYFNFTTFSRLVREVGLTVYKVKKVETQGGSLRVFITSESNREADTSVSETLLAEGSNDLIKERYMAFPDVVKNRKKEILQFIKNGTRSGVIIAGYGASAKATVLLNYIGVSDHEIVAIADKSLTKQGKYIPGAGIPIISIEQLKKIRPDITIIFAWNLKDEILKTLSEEIPGVTSAVTFMPILSCFELSRKV